MTPAVESLDPPSPGCDVMPALWILIISLMYMSDVMCQAVTCLYVKRDSFEMKGFTESVHVYCGWPKHL